MAGPAHLENLSNELFVSILSYIPLHGDLNNLCRTSRALYHRTVPSLYHSWSYHGLAKNPSDTKPWRKFLETVNWRPDLGAHVKEVDLREWGKCPRLEEWVGEFWRGAEEREAERREKEANKERLGREGGWLWGSEEDDDDDEEDGDFTSVDWNGGEDGAGDGDIEMEMAIDLDSEGDEEYEYGDFEDLEPDELDFLGPATPQRDENNESMFLKIGKEMGFGESLCTSLSKLSCFEWGPMMQFLRDNMALTSGSERTETVLDYVEILFEADEDKLVIKLLSKLPNLKRLYMVLPEDWAWHPEENVLHRWVDNTAGLRAAGILQQLETLYICSPMHLGGKDHREYTLDMKRVFPFMRLPSLRHLYTLTAHCFDDPGNFPPIDYKPLEATSNLTTLAHDEAELPPHDIIGSLSIPKALRSFRWTGEFTCFSIGSCYAPFQTSLGVALKGHRDSLETLYLDIRHRFCKKGGHHANPFATLESVRGVYGENFVARWEKKRGLKSAVMVGSFRDFKMLKSLAISATSLVGHQDWAASEDVMVDLLPQSLEELVLFVGISKGMGGEMLLENQLWYSQFLSLIRVARDRLSRLEKIELRIIGAPRGKDKESSEEVDRTLFIEAEGLCKDAGINFYMGNASPHGETNIPYFLEQTKDRNPGRDF